MRKQVDKTEGERGESERICSSGGRKTVEEKGEQTERERERENRSWLKGTPFSPGVVKTKGRYGVATTLLLLFRSECTSLAKRVISNCAKERGRQESSHPVASPRVLPLCFF